MEVGRSPIPQFDAFNLKPARQYYFRVTARSRRGGVEFEAMTRGRVDLARATAAPRLHTPAAAPAYRRVLAGGRLRLDCRFSGEPAPSARWTHTPAAGGGAVVLEEGVTSSRVVKEPRSEEEEEGEGEDDNEEEEEKEEEEAQGPIMVSMLDIARIAPSGAGKIA